MSVIDEYEIHPFEVTVQTYERTFVDQIFSICDYYLSGNINEHSRHLYDIYMIRPLISFDEQFFDLYVKVKEERSKIKVCYSAVSEKSISTLLNEIIESDAYKSDYNNRTTTLLMDAVGYKETIDNLKAISDLLIIKE